MSRRPSRGDLGLGPGPARAAGPGRAAGVGVGGGERASVDVPDGRPELTPATAARALPAAIDPPADAAVSGPIAVHDHLTSIPPPHVRPAGHGPARARLAAQGRGTIGAIARAQPSGEQLNRQVQKCLGPPLRLQGSLHAQTNFRQSDFSRDLSLNAQRVRWQVCYRLPVGSNDFLVAMGGCGAGSRFRATVATPGAAKAGGPADLQARRRQIPDHPAEPPGGRAAGARNVRSPVAIASATRAPAAGARAGVFRADASVAATPRALPASGRDP